MATSIESPDIWLNEMSMDDLCHVHKTLKLSTEHMALGVVLMHASWNKPSPISTTTGVFLSKMINLISYGLKDVRIFATSVQVDASDHSISLCIGDDDADPHNVPLPPADFPTLAFVFQSSNENHATIRYITSISQNRLTQALHSQENKPEIPSDIRTAARRTLQTIESELDLAVTWNSCNEALRLFVAGDRSSVGKSSVCLGILGNLLASGHYSNEDLAYIKPATQSESTQLIQLYCEKHEIDCRPIGPLVYYRGFTRAFLAGETKSTRELLESCGNAVDRIARGKKVVLVDGVGFPSVGSICGTDNASVAKACSYPAENGVRTPVGVVLVGGSGVGAAVDAFNLNATYFDKAGVPVLGAVFNKLEMSGYYSLANCKTEVMSYFDRSQEQLTKGRRPFGFIPSFPEISGPRAMEIVDDFLDLFSEYVDISALMEAALRVLESKADTPSLLVNGNKSHEPTPKRIKLEFAPRRQTRSRDEIESSAIGAGAAPSA